MRIVQKIFIENEKRLNWQWGRWLGEWLCAKLPKIAVRHFYWTEKNIEEQQKSEPRSERQLDLQCALSEQVKAFMDRLQ